MHRWMAAGAIAPFFTGCVVVGFDGPVDDSGVLEIGYEEQDPGSGEPGTFVPLAPGDRLPLFLGPGGLIMTTPSVRAGNVPAGSYDLEATLWLDGVIVAENLPWDLDPLEASAPSVVLSRTLVFQAELCCYNCREALLTARLTDSAGRGHRGQVTVLVARAECPDPAACCPSADLCPPNIAMVPLCM